MFDGWPDDFHDIEPSVGERSDDTGRADQHMQTRKMSATKPETQLPRSNDARAILIFAREISVAR
jgi:hypothetical protein